MNKVIKTLLFLLVFLILLNILLMYKNSFSSYISKITGKSTTIISEPIFIMEDSGKKSLNDSNTEIDYYFTIKNFENKRSEVDLKYFIEISPKQENFIVLTLYRDDVAVTLNDQKTNLIEMNHNSSETHKYRLNVKFDKEKTNSTINLKDNIYIKATAMQS